MDTNINIKTSTTMTINIQHQDNQLDDLCFDISRQQRNIASAMLGGFLKQLYLDAVSFVFLPYGFSCDILQFMCIALYTTNSSLSNEEPMIWERDE